MKISHDCIPCTINSYLRLVKTGIIPGARQESILRRLLEELAHTGYDRAPPVLARRMHAIIREELGNPDPYKKIKAGFNEMMIDLYSRLKDQTLSSADPFDAAMRLSIAGNVIDFGSQEQLNILETIDRVVDAPLGVDDSQDLRNALKDASSLLYIGDNCGEIVLDKLFLEQMDIPHRYFAVRGGPVINDVTREDARQVGMEDSAEIISSGDNAPGAVWGLCSSRFREVFQNADIVISKGQGNLEGLMDVSHPNIYFLLVTKCDLIAGRLGTGKGEFIVKKGMS